MNLFLFSIRNITQFDPKQSYEQASGVCYDNPQQLKH